MRQVQKDMDDTFFTQLEMDLEMPNIGVRND